MTLLDYQVNNFATTGNLSLIAAIVWIINNNYAKYTTTSLTLGQFACSEERMRFHYDLIDEILKKANIYKKHNTDSTANIKFILEGQTADKNGHFLNHLFRNPSDKELLQRNYGNKDKAIWFLDSLESFNYLESNLLNPHSHFHRNGHFCIVYTGTNLNRLQNINFIFQRLFQLYVININVIMLDDITPYVYTYFPFNAKSCRVSTPRLYASFDGIFNNKNFDLKKRFFPAKLHNMQGCKVIVATWHLPPMLFLKEGDKRTRIDGIEGNIINLLAENMNFSTEVIQPADGRGQFFKNGTATGAMKSVLTGECNITISNYLYDKRRSDHVLPSQTYLNIPVVVAIPRGRPMSPYVRLTKPFKYIIWSCLSSSLVLGILIILSLKLFKRTDISHFVFGHLNRIPLTNLCISFFGGTIGSILPKRNFARYILAVWLLYTLVMRNAYIGQLFIILQDGRSQTTLKSMAEVVRKNYTIYTSTTLEETLRSTLGTANLAFMDTTKPNFVRDLLKELQTNENARKVVLLLGATVRYFNRGRHDFNERINILPDSVLTVPITFYMTPHSYLASHVNSFLINMLSSGLILERESYYLESNFDFIKPIQEPIALSMWLLFGLFNVYLVLLIFCFLVFLLELWSRRSPLARGIIDSFNY